MRRKHNNDGQQSTRKTVSRNRASPAKAKPGKEQMPAAKRPPKATAGLRQELASVRLDLAEALEQQSATADILGVIASSPTDLKPVLDVVVTNAARLCAAFDCALVVADGDALRELAHHGPIPFLGDARFPLTRASVMGRAVLDHQVVHVPDLADSAEFPEGSALARQHGNRTTLAAPLLRAGRAFGALVVRRKEVRPFSDKQIALLKTFADQAGLPPWPAPRKEVRIES